MKVILGYIVLFSTCITGNRECCSPLSVFLWCAERLGSPWSVAAFGTSRKKEELHSNSFLWVSGLWNDAVTLQGLIAQNPWDPYFHTAARIAQKCKAVELVISCHLGSMSWNFWRMLETSWWDAWCPLCGPDHSRWRDYLLCFFIIGLYVDMSLNPLSFSAVRKLI